MTEQVITVEEYNAQARTHVDAMRAAAGAALDAFCAAGGEQPTPLPEIVALIRAARTIGEAASVLDGVLNLAGSYREEELSARNRAIVADAAKVRNAFSEWVKRYADWTHRTVERSVVLRDTNQQIASVTRF